MAHQLKINGETPLSLDDLRTKTADYLRENINDFLPFLSNPDSEDLLTPEEYEKYCNDVAETSAWGGAVEVNIDICHTFLKYRINMDISRFLQSSYFLCDLIY